MLLQVWAKGNRLLIRCGPDGHIIDTEVMPWNEYALAFTDEDLKMMIAYLHTLTPVE
jgi:hypothetical protein